MIFKGHLPIRSDGQLNGFVDHALKMRRKDFLPFVEKQSQQLVEHAQQMAGAAGAPYQRVRGDHSKEKLIREMLRTSPVREGLVVLRLTAGLVQTPGIASSYQIACPKAV